MSEEENSKSGHTKREGSFCLGFVVVLLVCFGFVSFFSPQKIAFADHETVRKMEQRKIKKYQNNWVQVNLT